MTKSFYLPATSSAQQEKCAAVIVEILTASFNQSSTKIKDKPALLSAARHIAQTKRLEIALEEKPDPWNTGPRLRGGIGPLYAWPSPFGQQENHAAVLYQLLRNAFSQTATKIKDDEALLSAARHVAQSGLLKIGYGAGNGIFEVLPPKSPAKPEAEPKPRGKLQL